MYRLAVSASCAASSLETISLVPCSRAKRESELSNDELKTHLAAVSHGTLHTIFRSKTPDGVRQEAHGLFVAYNLIRALMVNRAPATLTELTEASMMLD